MPRFVAFDTETWLIEPGRAAPPVVCLSWYDGKDGGLVDKRDGLRLLRSWIADPNVHFIGQNVAYDFLVYCAEYPDLLPDVFDLYEANRVHCTRVYQKQFEIARGAVTKASRYDLETLVSKHLGEDVEGKHGQDAWRMRYRELDGVAIRDWPVEARQYALLDAKYAWRVAMKQLEAVERHYKRPLPDVENQARYDFALKLMGAWGIRTDLDSVRTLETSLHEHVDHALDTLKAAGLFRLEGKSKPKLVQNMERTRELVLAELGALAPRTDGGAISTAGETLELCKHPTLVTLRDILGDRKLLNTYIPLLLKGAAGPLHPFWNVLVETGRTSCGDPNLQNQPRKPGVRECFTPRRGWAFFSVDYHTAELRSLAQVLLDAYGHSEMAESLRAGRDIHIETGAAIIGETYETVLGWYVGTDKALKARAKSARQLAKAANFGLPGGLGAKTFVTYAAGPDYRITLTQIQAQDIKNKWLGRFPEMRRYFSDITDAINGGGGSFTLVQPKSLRLRGGVGFCDGANSMFQGLTADGAKDALWYVIREMYDPTRRLNGAASPLYGTRANAFIHDEIFGEAPLQQAADAAHRCSVVMVERMQRVITDVPVTADPALMLRWSKTAGDPVFDKAGRLIPYEHREQAA